jgi:predicted KAP-like P-loop ATPase
VTRLAKKRRDSERDPSSVKRVLKAGGAVLAVGAGMALLSRTGKLSQFNDVMPVLRDTSRKFNKELLGKNKTAMNYYNAYNKAIGKKGEVVKRALRERKSLVQDAAKSLDYNPSTAKLTNAIGQLKHIAQTANVENIKNVDQLQFEKIKKGIKQGLKKKSDGTDSDFLKNTQKDIKIKS